jgi:hypothetical protein
MKIKDRKTESLMREYLKLGKDIFGMFANNAAIERDLIGAELLSRGFTEIGHMFGPIEITTNACKFVGGQSIARAMGGRQTWNR